ncbi:MAG: hypothetical protein FWC73_09735 [Defluviitaleaceae bacterium]|nr:hypothetical protein [Defluviitaleaceae bacterium]
MKKKLFAVAAALVIMLSSTVPVFAGPGSGGGINPPIIPPIFPRSMPICIQCDICICDDDIVMLQY